MKKLALAVMLLAFAVATDAQVTNPLTRAGIGGIPDCKDSLVFCVGKHTGAEYSTICGMTPGSGGANSCGDITDTCTAASAVGVATAATASDMKVIRVGPGLWNECVALDNIKNVRFIIEAGATIRPTVTTATSVDGGAIRIANSTTTADSATNITIENHGLIQNDAWNDVQPGIALEAAVMIGPETATNVESPWNNVSIIGSGGRIVAAHTGIAVRAQRYNSTTPLVPRYRIEGNDILAGAVGFWHWDGHAQGVVQNNVIHTMTNGCDDRSTTENGIYSGTVQAGTTGTSIVLDSSAPARDSVLAGRSIMFYGATCNLTRVDESNRYSVAYNGTTKALTVSGNGTAPDANCSYIVSPVANTGATGSLRTSAEPSCTDIGWYALRASAYDGTYSGQVQAFGVMLQASTIGYSAASRIIVANNVITTDVNDWGQNGSDPCQDVGIATHVGTGTGGIAAPVGKFDSFLLDGNYVQVNINTDIPSETTAGSCQPASGAMLSGNADIEGVAAFRGTVLMRNWADPDMPVACWSSQSTGTTEALQLLSSQCQVTSPTSHSGTARAGGSSTSIKLATGASAVNDAYNRLLVRATGGACANQIRWVYDYTGSTRLANTTPAWTACTPDATTTYDIGYVGNIDKTDGTTRYFLASTYAQFNSSKLALGGLTSNVAISNATSDFFTVTTPTLLYSAGLSGTVTEDLASPAGACTEGAAITVTGAVLGDTCVAASSVAMPAGVGLSCRVTAADTAKMSLCGTGDPANMTYTVRITK